MLMIVAWLDNMRINCPSIRAFLPSECQWVFHLSLSYVFDKHIGVATISRIKQVPQVKSTTSGITFLAILSTISVLTSPDYL
jgi:hypothetical protein